MTEKHLNKLKKIFLDIIEIIDPEKATLGAQEKTACGICNEEPFLLNE